jgi:hypothetical protein
MNPTTPTPMNLHITKDELHELAKEFVAKQRELFGFSKDEMYGDLGLLVEFIDYIENPTKRTPTPHQPT